MTAGPASLRAGNVVKPPQLCFDIADRQQRNAQIGPATTESKEYASITGRTKSPGA